MPVSLARCLRASLVCVALLLAACSSPSRSVRAASLKPDKERKQAPEFALKDAYGRVVRLSDYRGKVVLLNFWATWCGPCKIEIPWFIDFERRYRDRGFAVIGIAMDDEGWEVVKPYIGRMAINYRIVQGSEEITSLYGGVEALPTTFMIDRSGKVATVHVGLAGKGDFEDGIKQLVDASAEAQRAGARSALPAFLVRPR